MEAEGGRRKGKVEGREAERRHHEVDKRKMEKLGGQLEKLWKRLTSPSLADSIEGLFLSFLFV